MKIQTLNEVGLRPGGKLFRTLVFPNILIFLVFVGAGIFLAFGYVAGGVPMWALIFFELVLVLVSLFVLGTAIKGFLSTNWLMVLSDNEVLIKYRSYLNCDMPRSDKQVFAIGINEITGIRKVSRKVITYGMRGRKRTRYLTFLDIILAGRIAEEVKEALVAEQTTRKTEDTFYGSKSSKALDYPVSVKDDYTLRVRMSWVRPNTGRAMEWFGCNGVEQLEARRESEDFTVIHEDKVQMEDSILSLVMSGKKIDAVMLARRAYGMNITEAREFVESLVG